MCQKGLRAQSAGERGGKENPPVLMRELGSISYYVAWVGASCGRRKQNLPEKLRVKGDAKQYGVRRLAAAF
jgi:hypothetical protein